MAATRGSEEDEEGGVVAVAAETLSLCWYESQQAIVVIHAPASPSSMDPSH
jgi:hypothetical protein